MKAAIYCRLSVEDYYKEEKSESIKNQLSLLEDYAQKQDLSIYDYYIDDNYSGLDKTRPAFNRMIQDAKSHCFDIILCKNQSRFTRDIEIAEKYLHGLFPIWNIRLIGICDGVDTNNHSNKKIRQLNGLINEWYCEDLSENIRMVLKNKMKHGQFIGSFACYGYVKGKDHELLVDEPAAKVVRRIFDLYVKGQSMAKIAAILTKKQIPTPSEYNKACGSLFKSPHASSTWSVSTIKRILHDETYIGTLVQGRVSKISYKNKYMKPNPKEEWIRVKNHHEAIVDKSIFFRINPTSH